MYCLQPLPAALHTVEPFARQAGLDVAIDTDLRERNLAEGYATDWETLIRRAWDDLSFRAPGGESVWNASSVWRPASKGGSAGLIADPPLRIQSCLAHTVTPSACI